MIDAGPPFGDDSETYPDGGKYHDGSPAFPVLQDGECAGPLKSACVQRDTVKQAYLEGPISCGDNGWYCRIMPDPNWPTENLLSDVNFGHCNTTVNFADAGYDQDGHCHGSAKDNTYYWWVRDHFFRAYNGRLRCCCGWYEGTSSTPMYGRRIANRCDYRRQVTREEDISRCRDANEDHGLGFDDIGCDSQYKESQLNKPIPEDDGICWEVGRFGFYEGPPLPDPVPVPVPPPIATPTAEPTEASADSCLGPFPGFDQCELKISFVMDIRPDSWLEKRGLARERCAIQDYYNEGVDGDFCPSPF